MGQSAEAKPEGDLIDLWDTPLTAVHDPDHLKRIKSWMVFTGPSDAEPRLHPDRD